MKGSDVVNQRTALIQRAMLSEDGLAMMDLLRANFDGDTFDLDPHKHAYQAGQRSVLIWITTYMEAKPDENQELPDI